MSQIEICNRALTTYLREARITSLTEDSAAAEHCSLHLVPAIHAVMARHPWNWARKRETLAAVVNDREGEWQFKYTAPIDLMLVIWVNQPILARLSMSRHETPDAPREIMGGYVYTDVEDAVMEYVAEEVDTTLFPPLFYDAVAAELAVRIAMPITGNVSIMNSASQMSEIAFDRARTVDSMSVPPLESAVPSWLSARGIS